MSTKAGAIQEALEVADTVVVMNAGKIEQVGSPDDIYDSPASPFVYQFLGDVNLFHTNANRNARAERLMSTVYARPHELHLERVPSDREGIETRLSGQRRIGAVVRLLLERTDGGGVIEAELTHERYLSEQWRDGDQVWVRPMYPRRFSDAVH